MRHIIAQRYGKKQRPRSFLVTVEKKPGNFGSTEQVQRRAPNAREKHRNQVREYRLSNATSKKLVS
jgi:hypothetical protein